MNFDVRDAWGASIPPKDRRPIYEWGKDHIRNLPPVLSKTGAFDIGASTHFREPFEAIADDRVREVNVCAPPRSGKTLLADVSIPWLVSVQGSSILFVIQTDEMAKSHAELRTMPLLNSVASVRAMLPDDRHKNRGQEIIFANGLPLIVCGPAISNLQNRGFRTVIIDEAWRVAADHPGRIGEAKTRLGDFLREQLSKLLVISQGGTWDDDWHIQFSSSVLHEWTVPCAGCGQFIIPKIHGKHADGRRWGLVWDSRDRPDGKFDRAHALTTLRFECPLCAHRHHDTPATKAAWSAAGRYQCMDPEGDLTKKSYHWENVIDYPWRELASLWFSAREQAHIGNEGPTIQFFQKQCASFHNPSFGAHVETLPSVEIVTPAPETKKFWEKQDCICLSLDKQLGHYWGLVEAWCRGGESMLLWAGRLESKAEIEAKQAEFHIPDECVMMDGGNWRMEVAADCVQHGHATGSRLWWERWSCWWMLLGDDATSYSYSYIEKGEKKTKRLPYSWEPEANDPCFGMHADAELRKLTKGRKCPTIRWSNPTVKDIAGSRRQALMEGKLAFVAKGVSEHFARHIFAEAKMPDPKNMGKMKWQPKSKKLPNHLWDCWCQSIVFALRRGIIGAVGE